jgi:IS1 family transposase
VAWERSQDIVQALVDHAPKATWYYSDALEVYATLWYHWGRYAISEGKTDTYSVEGNNAELRHYLARLARSSRCFSRCPYALHCAVRLFAYYFNQWQLRKHQFPHYSFHITDFVHSPI